MPRTARTYKPDLNIPPVAGIVAVTEPAVGKHGEIVSAYWAPMWTAEMLKYSHFTLSAWASEDAEEPLAVIMYHRFALWVASDRPPLGRSGVACLGVEEEGNSAEERVREVGA